MKNVKKLLALLLTIAMLLTVASCAPANNEGSNTDENANSAAETESEVYQIAFVSDQALDASEWLVNLVAGIEEYQASNENVEIRLVEATVASEYEPKIRALAEDGVDAIITTYSSMADATIAVANDFPEIKFGSLDGSITDIEQYSNIQEFGLNRTQTAYLAGVVAASMSETGVVGIVAGQDEPVINAIVAGWQQGLVSVNPDIVDYVSYAGTWTDPTTGNELGLALIDEGCDVIAAAAGGTGAGTAQAAADSGVYYVAWDTHYTDIFAESNVELGSALNFFDIMVIQFIEDVIAGDFQGGQRVEYGMDAGVCTFDILDTAPVSDEAKAVYEAELEKVKNGEIELSSEPLHK